MPLSKPRQSYKIDTRLEYFNCCTKCAMCFWKAFKWIPVLLILSCLVWAYYAYVYQLCLNTVESTAQACIYLAVFHLLLFMLLWSYFRTVFTDIKSVPDKFKLPNSELEKLLNAESEDAQRMILEDYARDLPLVTRTNSGSIRYCNRCVIVKPDRAHHCSICAKCVLKMDHHCPWMNNCVCYYNYKFFMLFLGYALITCLFIMTTSLPYFIKYWKGEFGVVASVGRYHIVFAFVVSLMLGISLGSLFSYHCYLIINNRTTLEAFRAPTFHGGPDKDGFSIGYLNNLKEVFGARKDLWLLPVFTSTADGCEYPVRLEHQLQTFTRQPEPPSYESMGVTKSRSDEADRPDRHIP